MARLIDADKLKSDYDITNWGKPYGCSFKVIDRQPTVDAEHVRNGKWIEKPYLIGISNFCSVCGENFGSKYKYCPNCGAKMTGGINNADITD